MNCTKQIQIDNITYTADIDFRTILKCEEIMHNEDIDEFEKTLGMICTVFGEDALDNIEHYEKLIKWIINYMTCGKETENTNEEPDMDFIEDMEYIEASFMSDYHIDLENTKMEWQKFYKLVNGLSNSEFGNCCILNRIRNLRNYDTKDIKDPNELSKIIKQKEQFALKKRKKQKETELTEKQQQSVDEFYKALGY